MQNNNAIVPFSAHNAVELVKQLRLAVDILRGSGELVAGIDYGRIPGTGDKDTLLLPGMEKLCRALNAVPEYLERHVERDYDKPLFHYEYECRLIDADTGLPIPGGRGLGSCNSRESGFAWRFVQAHELPADLDISKLQKQGGKTSEFDFAINKAETSGKYGKPAEYWQAFRNAIAAGTAVRGERETARGMSPTWEIDTTVYRIPNPAIFDQINAIMKRAKKRALGDAIKGAANVSAYFTVDMEDFVPGTVINPDSGVIQGTYTVVEPGKSESEASASVRGAGIPQQAQKPIEAPVSYWSDDETKLTAFYKSAVEKFSFTSATVDEVLERFEGLGLGDWCAFRSWALAALVAEFCDNSLERIDNYTASMTGVDEKAAFELSDKARRVANALLNAEFERI